jgi:peptide/nickel transport system substrate-binding protein
MRTSSLLLIAMIAAIPLTPAQGQTRGGTLRIYNTSQPPSASIHEESTIATNMPFMAIFNNLVVFDPSKSRNSFDTIVPELAESWAWDETGTKLTFKLRSGVAWHDGKPFTAKDVACTWHRLNGKEPEYLKRNPRAIWYENLKEVTVNGEYEATFHLSKPQPSLLPMLASGLSPVYPCHVSDKDMRTRPIGTGPFTSSNSRAMPRSRWRAIPTIGKRGGPTSTASNGASSRAGPRGCWPSSPRSST